ncbi:hypothetical protein N4562_04370 [Ligilactobacillus agilis]|uniref:Uncharacterized protein n=1 Tax=Ligilactobacillus agilis TaxID=1601 RepID=A0A9Q9J6G9_9LACO|nr:hypothetical protein [Ligilactobacillus agilis]UXC64256.1 hypothetical protein N4562_04370 [Ligilactobacillus agilis]UXC66256.1 hypothetical protein N4597_04375 [Ligilactobacillus agilis]
MKNSEAFDMQLMMTRKIFKVAETSEKLFNSIQVLRPRLSTPVDYDEVRAKANEKYFEKLYFATDSNRLYYIDEESLAFINANPLEILRIPSKLISVEEIIAKSSNVANDLYAKVISNAEKTQIMVILELLEDRLREVPNRKEIFRDLVVGTRKKADVSFADFDSQFTSKLGYEDLKAKGETVIYRGENMWSQNYLFAYSWTTSREKAESFANRFEDGKVLQAKIPNNRIIYTYKNDEEHEVLVNSDYLLEVVTL